MTFGIPSIPPFNLPPVDIWGRSATEVEIDKFVNSEAAVREAREHLLRYLSSCYLEPLAALAAAEKLYLDQEAAMEKIAPAAAAEQVQELVSENPLRLGKVRDRLLIDKPKLWKPKGKLINNPVVLNFQSVPILLKRYLEIRATTAQQRSKQVHDQMDRDAVEIPPLDAIAHDYFQRVSQIAEPAELAQVWRVPSDMMVVKALEDYAAIVRRRLGAATPIAYLDAAKRTMSRSPDANVYLQSLRLALRVLTGVERITTAVANRI